MTYPGINEVNVTVIPASRACPGLAEGTDRGRTPPEGTDLRFPKSEIFQNGTDLSRAKMLDSVPVFQQLR